eukprot:364772-Chlamydomonas_euryale.AAC.15
MRNQAPSGPGYPIPVAAVKSDTLAVAHLRDAGRAAAQPCGRKFLVVHLSSPLLGLLLQQRRAVAGPVANFVTSAWGQITPCGLAASHTARDRVCVVRVVDHRHRPACGNVGEAGRRVGIGADLVARAKNKSSRDVEAILSPQACLWAARPAQPAPASRGLTRRAAAHRRRTSPALLEGVVFCALPRCWLVCARQLL